MEPQSTSSLQRFIGSRGKDYVDLQPFNARRVLKSIWLSIAIMPIAIILVGVLTTGQDFLLRMVAVSVILLISAPIMPLVMARRLRTMMQEIAGERSKPITLPNGVTVTPAAQDMVMMLYWHFMSQYPGAEAISKQMDAMAKKRRARAAQQSLAITAAMRAKSEQALAGAPKVVMDLLEQAAFQYNRSIGLVETLGLTADGPNIAKGADEAMVVVLHQARQLVKYPESLGAMQGRLAAGVDTLRELADSVEALTALHGSAPTMALGELLDDLRLRLAALGELSSQQANGTIPDRNS